MTGSAFAFAQAVVFRSHYRVLASGCETAELVVRLTRETVLRRSESILRLAAYRPCQRRLSRTGS